MLLVKAFFKVVGEVVGGALVALLVTASFIALIVCSCQVLDIICGFLAGVFGDGWAAFTNFATIAVPFVLAGLVVIGGLLLLGVSVYDEYQKMKAKKEGMR